ncbi:MAG: hypothetical protein F6J94_26845 [Moorea sp. SIO1F2]|uniref:hypothetical protein n=1 Tax=unclassified Moorena TaxID=2683338 RepID=UPI0013B9F707|nr:MULTISPECIES: hypothetical protein [unclassified Moorena]NEP23279.1 hypothetical protein [Moorena sp. SIO3I6]NET85388.1 hypothetical protein [Moorena sp. SIO1F2]
MKIAVKQTKQVRQYARSHLSPQSYTAYQDFLDRLRKGKKIIGERPVDFHRPNCYHFQLSTGDWIIYCVEHKRILWFELTEITVEVLYPKENVDQIVTLALALMHSDPARPPQNLLGQLVNSSISIADNSQRLIFAVQFLLTIGTAILMLLPQFTSSSLEEKIQPPTSESGAVTEERDQIADTESNRSP